MISAGLPAWRGMPSSVINDDHGQHKTKRIERWRGTNPQANGMGKPQQPGRNASWACLPARNKSDQFQRLVLKYSKGILIIWARLQGSKALTRTWLVKMSRMFMRVTICFEL